MKRAIRIFFGIVVGLLAVVGAGAILVAVLFLNAWPSMRWPDIPDSQALRADCAALLAKQEAAYVPKEDWPQSIKAMAPKDVGTAGDHVCITISGGGIGAGWGYIVFPKTVTVSSEMLTSMMIWGTGKEGVFRFQMVE